MKGSRDGIEVDPRPPARPVGNIFSWKVTETKTPINFQRSKTKKREEEVADGLSGELFDMMRLSCRYFKLSRVQQ